MWINYEEVMYWAGLGWDEDWSEERKDQTAREGIKRLYNAASFGDVEGREDGVVILEVYSEKYTPAFDLICDEFGNMWDKSGLDREDLVAEKFIKKISRNVCGLHSRRSYRYGLWRFSAQIR